jgi:hypothetical protein
VVEQSDSLEYGTGNALSRRWRCGRLAALLLALVSAGLLSCGKKGDPQPPLPRGPNAVSDLAVEQEGGDAVLTFSFPDRLLTGSPLRDLETIEIYRLVNPSSALTSPRPSGAPAAGGSKDRAPGSAARRTAGTARLAEQAFYREARSIAALSLPELAQQTRGATIVFRDPLEPLLAAQGKPTSLAYAVVSVRRSGERSPVSNLATLAPAVPPGPPVTVRLTPEEGRICLEWIAPEKDLLGQPAEVGGYHVYRRTLPEEEYGPPLNADPLPGTSFVDTAPPYGATHVYTLRATVPNRPRVEGLAAEEAGVEYRDVYPPAPPGRLDALPEAGLVRLIWDSVAAPDLAGYLLFRAEGAGAASPITTSPISDTFYSDESVQTGRRYRYTVVAIDSAGNRSAASPEAVGEPF